MEKIIKKNKPQIIMMPNYKNLYSDLINEKYPNKKHLLKTLQYKRWSALDVIIINNLIIDYEEKEKTHMNQKYRSYDKETIFNILDYQRKNNLNNTQLSKVFNISRNTITKWKRLFF